jgi:hypothetical protein
VRISLVRGARPFRFPRAAAAAGALLVVLGLMVASVPPETESPVTCPFRLVTGLPCFSCGLVRAAHWLMRGEVGRAFAVNPLMAAGLLVAAPLLAALWLLNRLFGVAVRLELGPAERRAAWVLLAASVVANWAYVLATHH